MPESDNQPKNPSAKPSADASPQEEKETPSPGNIERVQRNEIFPPNPANSEAEESDPTDVPSEDSDDETQVTQDNNNPGVAPIRTYETDTQSTVQQTRASIAEMAVAQQEADRKAGVSRGDTKEHPIRKVLGIMASTLLIVAALSAIGYGVWHTQFRTADESPSADGLALPTFFRTENLITIPVTAEVDTGMVQTRLREIRQGSSVEAPDDAVTRIYMTQEVQNTNGEEVGAQLISFSQFLRHADTRIPARLARSVDAYLYGMHSTPQNDTAQPFMVLKVDSYENAFAGMLQWEPSITDNLLNLFGADLLAAEPAANPTPTPMVATSSTTTAATSSATTTTPPSPSQTTPAPTQFVDRVISNEDVRILFSRSGDVRLAWSFAQPDTLVITTSRETLEEIFDRLQQAQFSR